MVLTIELCTAGLKHITMKTELSIVEIFIVFFCVEFE